MEVVVIRTRIESGRVVEEPVLYSDGSGAMYERVYHSLEAAKLVHGHECGIMYVQLPKSEASA